MCHLPDKMASILRYWSSACSWGSLGMIPQAFQIPPLPPRITQKYRNILCRLSFRALLGVFCKRCHLGLTFSAPSSMILEEGFMHNFSKFCCTSRSSYSSWKFASNPWTTFCWQEFSLFDLSCKEELNVFHGLFFDQMQTCLGHLPCHPR